MKMLRILMMPLMLHLMGLVLVGGMSDVWVELRAPRFVVHRHGAALHCDHNVDSESIYKVVFYKDGRHFMRYIRNRDPPYEIFNITGAEINIAKVTSNSVTLEKLDFPASGSYACEIALETPLYSKVSKIQELSVFVRQKYRPKVKIDQTRFLPDDFLDAMCHSGPAYPAPHLTWFINNAKVDEKMTIPHGTASSNRHHHGMLLSTTSSSLHFPLPALGPVRNQTVDITCFSTIPSYATFGNGYADAQNTTIAVKIFRLEPAPTELPVLIASTESASSRPRAAHLLTVFIYLVYRNV